MISYKFQLQLTYDRCAIKHAHQWFWLHKNIGGKLVTVAPVHRQISMTTQVQSNITCNMATCTVQLTEDNHWDKRRLETTSKAAACKKFGWCSATLLTFFIIIPEVHHVMAKTEPNPFLLPPLSSLIHQVPICWVGRGDFPVPGPAMPWTSSLVQ